MKIGLEVHMYPKTESKMYCSCPASDAEPNTNLCPICTAQPGSKPMATNKEALKVGIMVSKALNCELVDSSIATMRKHYFYPDLPNNYQRTSKPFAINGKFKDVTIHEIHWEEDPGKFDLKAKTVDFNRSGFPLLEIVTDPDIRDADHAREFLRELRDVLSYLGVSRGGFKVDTNVSTEGERVEMKNISSIRGVETAIINEIKRQEDLLSKGKEIRRETRGFDEDTGKTYSLRDKEEAADYRYMNDPDIPPVILDMNVEMPKPLDEVRDELRDKGLDEDSVIVISRDSSLLNLFNSSSTNPKFTADFIVNRLLGELSYREISFSESKTSKNDIIGLIERYSSGEITQIQAKEMLRTLLDGKRVEEKSFSEDDVSSVISRVLLENEDVVEKYRSGKESSLNYLFGQCAKELRGSVEPEKLRKMILEKLS